MPSFQLLLSSNAFDSRELSELLTEAIVLPADCHLELQGGEASLRSPDQTVLVAVVAGTSVAFFCAPDWFLTSHREPIQPNRENCYSGV